VSRIHFREMRSGFINKAMPFVVLLWSVLAASARALPAQVTVKQGPAEYQHFSSPMILELPFKALQPENVGKWITTTETNKFECDGVVLTTIRYLAKVKRGSVHVTLKADTYTLHGEDKSTQIRFDVLEKKTLISSTWMNYLRTEEDEESKDVIYFKFAGEDLPAGVTPILRITVYVSPDG